MSFTTITFMFAFLPLILIFYFAFYMRKKREGSLVAGNAVLLIGSFVFYAWAAALGVVMLFLYAVVLYLVGYFLEIAVKEEISLNIPYYQGESIKRKKLRLAFALLIVGLVLIVGVLYHFKYASTVATLISDFWYIDSNRYANLIVPLGISFLTFSAITYLVDIYRGEASAGSFADCLCYLFFFPKVVSGPIIPWKEFQPQLWNRKIVSEDFVQGINRLSIGLAKKVILADTFGSYASEIQNIRADVPTAWLGWALYAFQIYYDFAGYSDIAIGISKMFGFRFAENFDFPYRAISVSEFWRRWHISLGTFFRNYVYIPLGGNRRGTRRTLINLAVVFLITGIWHGVGLAYIIWGALHGFVVLAERLAKGHGWYEKIPHSLKWAGTFFFVASTWQFFRYGNAQKALASLAHLIGVHSYETSSIIFPYTYYVDHKILVLLVIGFLGALIPGNKRLRELVRKILECTVPYFISEVVLLLLLILSVVFMVSSTYSPFIYFQF